MTAGIGTDPLRRRLADELERYGLAVPATDDAQAWTHALEILLRHIHTNHTLALAVANETIDILSARPGFDLDQVRSGREVDLTGPDERDGAEPCPGG